MTPALRWACAFCIGKQAFLLVFLYIDITCHHRSCGPFITRHSPHHMPYCHTLSSIHPMSPAHPITSTHHKHTHTAPPSFHSSLDRTPAVKPDPFTCCEAGPWKLFRGSACEARPPEILKISRFQDLKILETRS